MSIKDFFGKDLSASEPALDVAYLAKRQLHVSAALLIGFILVAFPLVFSRL
ncbi:hypothetical protein [Methylovirgula sp. 4M-Z18]|uniref:hypothetical protein n=1 Tax=Methylovirgula sp. 4M-Z18 TaxID=2293567 RepID=UPI0013149441|nr:hypothetical protein [Methylovirgula sp. 4M-Z18]